MRASHSGGAPVAAARRPELERVAVVAREQGALDMGDDEIRLDGELRRRREDVRAARRDALAPDARSARGMKMAEFARARHQILDRRAERRNPIGGRGTKTRRGNPVAEGAGEEGFELGMKRAEPGSARRVLRAIEQNLAQQDGERVAIMCLGPVRLGGIAPLKFGRGALVEGRERPIDGAGLAVAHLNAVAADECDPRVPIDDETRWPEIADDIAARVKRRDASRDAERRDVKVVPVEAGKGGETFRRIAGESEGDRSGDLGHGVADRPAAVAQKLDRPGDRREAERSARVFRRRGDHRGQLARPRAVGIAPNLGGDARFVGRKDAGTLGARELRSQAENVLCCCAFERFHVSGLVDRAANRLPNMVSTGIPRRNENPAFWRDRGAIPRRVRRR